MASRLAPVSDFLEPGPEKGPILAQKGSEISPVISSAHQFSFKAIGLLH